MTPEMAETRTHKTTVWMNQAELDLLSEAAKGAGASRGDLVRQLIRMYATDTWSPAEIEAKASPPEIAEALREIETMQGRLGWFGSNVNQLARAANTFGYSEDTRGWETVLAEVRELQADVKRIYERLEKTR